jgi:phosphate:Na+ symporter
VREAADALRQAQVFMSDVQGPPETEDEQQRLTSTLHTLDHASRLAEAASEEVDFRTASGGPDDARAAALCADAMQTAAAVAGEVAALPDIAAIEPSREALGSAIDGATPETPAGSTKDAMARLERSAKELSELRRTHRATTLSAVANGALTAGDAIVRVDTVRTLEALAHHAWRSAAHLVGRGG